MLIICDSFVILNIFILANVGYDVYYVVLNIFPWLVLYILCLLIMVFCLGPALVNGDSAIQSFSGASQYPNFTGYGWLIMKLLSEPN